MCVFVYITQIILIQGKEISILKSQRKIKRHGSHSEVTFHPFIFINLCACLYMYGERETENLLVEK